MSHCLPRKNRPQGGGARIETFASGKLHRPEGPGGWYLRPPLSGSKPGFVGILRGTLLRSWVRPRAIPASVALHRFQAPGPPLSRLWGPMRSKPREAPCAVLHPPLRQWNHFSKRRAARSRRPGRGAPCPRGPLRTAGGPHLCLALGRPSASTGENRKQNPHQKKRKRSGAGWSEEQVTGGGRSRLGPAWLKEQPHSPAVSPKSGLGGPLGSFERNRRPGMSRQTLLTRTLPGSICI